jgi:hypothetical protein
MNAEKFLWIYRGCPQKVRDSTHFNGRRRPKKRAWYLWNHMA